MIASDADAKRVAQPDGVRDERGAGDEARAERGQARRRAHRRRPQPGSVANVHSELVAVPLGEGREPLLEHRDVVRCRALLRAEHARRVEETRLDVARDLDLGTAEIEAERLERAEAAVDGRRAADRDDHARRAGVDRGADQLAGPVRRRAERVVRAGDEREPARARHLDDAGARRAAPTPPRPVAERARHRRQRAGQLDRGRARRASLRRRRRAEGRRVRPGPRVRRSRARPRLRGPSGCRGTCRGSRESGWAVVTSSRSEVWQRLGTPTPVDGRSTFPAVLRREPRGVATRPSSARSRHRDGTDTSHVSRYVVSMATVTTPWGKATSVEEVAVPQRAGEKRFATRVELLETAGGERLVRFSYASDGTRGGAR